MLFQHVYYEKDSLNYQLGQLLEQKYKDLPWTEIESHNRIEEMQKKQNSEFAKMKRNLIIGIRKTHKYKENSKVSDYLVPYTSSGCTAMCLYCYLVCNYNKCSYLRLFVNREAMMQKLLKHANGSDAKEMVYEIGSNSDLILENGITGNLVWTIEQFSKSPKGQITFPTKFDQVDELLPLDHKKKVIFRMSVNPQEIINKIEFGTSPLNKRILAANKMQEAGYPVGMLIAPIVRVDNWQPLYEKMFDELSDSLTEKLKKQLVLEIIFMTYSYIHRAINNDAFPNAIELYDKGAMTGRGRGKYTYKNQVRVEMEDFLREQIEKKLEGAKILYFC